VLYKEIFLYLSANKQPIDPALIGDLFNKNNY